MYPNQGGYPNQPYPFGSNMPQVPYPSAQTTMPFPQQMPPNAGFSYANPQPGGYAPGSSVPPFPQQMPPNAGFSYANPQPGGCAPLSSMPPYQQFAAGNVPTQGYPTQSNFPPASSGIYPQIPNDGAFQNQPCYMPQQPYQPYGQNAGAREVPIQQHFSPNAYNQSPAVPTRKGRPTVLAAASFDASNDASILRKAMKGFGTDENSIINILCRRPNHQRIEIVRAYKTAYGKDLINDIKSETSGNFEKVLVALLTPTLEYYCQELNCAMSGAGTDEDVLVEVMCTMSNAEIKQIGAFYYRIYGKSLEETLREDTSGSVKRLFTSLSVGGRDESMVTNIEAARNDAQALKKAGIDRWGTDESEFNRILCLRNYEQLKLICEEYKKLTGNTLEKDIKKEFSGDIEDALLAIVRVSNSRPEFFARRLKKAMAGLGTNDRSLIRLCVTRSEIDMMDIKDEFQRYYSKTLKSFLKGDTSGHYRNALYVLCGESRD